MIRRLTRLFRNIFLSSLVVALFVHPPAFLLFQSALYYLHVIARTTFVHIRSSLQNASSIGLDVFVKSCVTEFLIFCAPVIRPVLPWITKTGVAMIRLSPAFICYMNGKMIEMGEYIVSVVTKGDDKEMIMAWRAVAIEVAGFCKVTDAGVSGGWFW